MLINETAANIKRETQLEKKVNWNGKEITIVEL
jgi:hypothetical protein